MYKLYKINANASFHFYFLAISSEGRVSTGAFMAEYNQDRFELEIIAQEVEAPQRIARAKVIVSF